MKTNKPEVKRFNILAYQGAIQSKGAMCVMASDYDALQAECEKLRKDAARYVPLHEAVQRAAGELPAGWAIQLCVERHSGWVELIGPGGTEDLDTNNERLDYTVIDALEFAIQVSNP